MPPNKDPPRSGDTDNTSERTSSFTETGSSGGHTKELSSFRDRADAGKMEIFIYSLGGQIDDLTASAYRNLSSLLIIAFGMNPLLVGLLGAIKTIWDGIADPLVAYWSDTCNTRFGRRRPFILAGGLIMAVLTWFTWQFMPENENLRPNDPLVPEVAFSNHEWKSLANLHLAFSVPAYDLSVEVEAGETDNIDPDTLRIFAEESVRTLGRDSLTIVGLASEDADEGIDAPDASAGLPRYTLTFRALEASAPVVAGSREARGVPFSGRVEARLRGPGIEGELRSEVAFDALEETLTERKRDKIFAERVAEFFMGPPEEAGLRLQATHTRANHDILARRAAERALLFAQRLAMTELLAMAFALPYERILQDDAVVSDSIQTQIRERARERIDEEPDLLVALFISDGLQIDPRDGIDETEAQKIADYRASFETEDTAAVVDKLYTRIEIDAAASYHALMRNPRGIRQFQGIWDKVLDGISSIADASEQERRFFWFVLFVFIAMAVGSTLYNAPYYAQGIEIAPSYNGRTLVVAYRQVVNQLMNIVSQIFLPLSLLPIFLDAREGNLFLVYVTAPLGIMLTLLVFFGTKERTIVVREKGKRPGFFRAIKEIGANGEFWRITALYIFMGYAIGSFQGLGNLLAVYYVFDGNLVRGTGYQAIVGTIGILMALASVPVFVILCNKLGKHVALRIAIGFLGVASVVKYWLYNPEMPELMFITAFLYSPAIAGFYKVLSTMMGDVTDLDELRNGERREGMFGAVMAIIMKTLGSFSALFSGIVIVATGFEVTKGMHQDPGVFHNMLLWFSIIPGVVCLAGFLLLMRFKLTPEFVADMKEKLAQQRRAQAEALEAKGREQNVIGAE